METQNKLVALSLLATASFTVGNGLRVADLRNARKTSQPAYNKLEGSTLLAKWREIDAALPQDAEKVTFADYADVTDFDSLWEALLAQYEGIRNFPKDIGRFTMERAMLRRYYDAAKDIAESMDEADFTTSVEKEAASVLWRGEKRNAFDLATELLGGEVEKWRKGLEKDSDPNALFTLCNAAARALGSKGTLRPAKVETEAKDSDSDSNE